MSTTVQCGLACPRRDFPARVHYTRSDQAPQVEQPFTMRSAMTGNVVLKACRYSSSTLCPALICEASLVRYSSDSLRPVCLCFVHLGPQVAGLHLVLVHYRGQTLQQGTRGEGVGLKCCGIMHSLRRLHKVRQVRRQQRVCRVDLAVEKYKDEDRPAALQVVLELAGAFA